MNKKEILSLKRLKLRREIDEFRESLRKLSVPRGFLEAPVDNPSEKRIFLEAEIAKRQVAINKLDPSSWRQKKAGWGH